MQKQILGFYNDIEIYNILNKLVKTAEPPYSFLISHVESEIFFEPKTLLEKLEDELTKNIPNFKQNFQIEKIANNSYIVDTQQREIPNSTSKFSKYDLFMPKKIPNNPRYINFPYETPEFQRNAVSEQIRNKNDDQKVSGETGKNPYNLV